MLFCKRVLNAESLHGEWGIRFAWDWYPRAAWSAGSVRARTSLLGILDLSHVQLRPVRSHVLHLLADVVDQRWVLLFYWPADIGQLSLHLRKVNCCDPVFEFVVQVNTVLFSQREGAPEKFQLLVGQHLQEEETRGVVKVELDGTSVDRRIGDGLIEKLDKHGQVVSKEWVQLLLLAHLLIIENVAAVFVQKKEVFLTGKLNFDDFRGLIWTLE